MESSKLTSTPLEAKIRSAVLWCVCLSITKAVNWWSATLAKNSLSTGPREAILIDRTSSGAAFYSDCEHEVREVTSGYRLTLTYNLYVTRGLGHLAGSPSALDPSQLPLYEALKNALDNPGFLSQGRVLAVWLTHSYAHTSSHVNFLPSSLKGADMALYEAASALDLWRQVVPVMKKE